MSRQKLVVLFVVTVLLFGTVVGPLAVNAQTSSAPGSPLTELERMEQFWQDVYGASSTTMFPNLNQPLPMGGELLAKAQPDECFDGVGSVYPPGPPCVTGKAKVNQAYVWGLTQVGQALWFGTATNVHCMVLGAYLGLTTPIENKSWVCEFGDSQYSPPLSAAIGDWRPPRIYTYNTAGDILTEKTPPDLRIGFTLGLRAAANLNNVVLLGGPSLTGGINLFAYQADTGAYLGSTKLSAYNNIRKSVVVDGVLYLGVGKVGGAGSVLRWRGDVTTPFVFENVGDVGGDAAELVLHEGRIFVSTWPQASELAGLFMSPPIPAGGLTTADAAGWTKVWQVDAYEPDPVTAATYGGGALISFKGYLYWGTMHVPFLAGMAHFDVYGMPSEPADILVTLLGSHRAISLFRGRNFATTPEVELLYGNPILPAYVPGAGWQIVPNKMNKLPRYGLAGFNYFFNNYTWSMAVYQDQLFVGTMDWSYLFASALVGLLQSMNVADAAPMVESLQLPPNFFGADLFRFVNNQYPAVPVSVAGVGNFTSYGVRNMVSAPQGLYLGMANPMNLLTDPGPGWPNGGWELIGLYKLPAPQLVGYVYVDTNTDGWRQNTETGGLAGVPIKLMQFGNLVDQTVSYNGGWYQFDLVMPGQYTVEAAIPPEYQPTSVTSVNLTKHHFVTAVANFGVEKKWAKIGDRVWYDANANGILEATDSGMGNVTVALLADNAGAPGAVVATTTTAADGAYLFDGIMPGTYWVQVTDEHGVTAGRTLMTGPNSQPNPHGPITVAHRQSYLDADFGYAFIPGPGQTVIADLVWNDLNGNGVRDPGEPGLAGIQVCAQPLGHAAIFCAITDANGVYGIEAPASRTYLVAVTIPPVNMTETKHDFYMPLVVLAGQRYMYLDFGYR